MCSLDHIFKPRSIAVVGASRRIGSIGREILHNLEQGELNDMGQPRLAQGDSPSTGQLALFAAQERTLREELSRLDVDRLTPLDALTRLHALVQLARKDDD